MELFIAACLYWMCTCLCHPRASQCWLVAVYRGSVKSAPLVPPTPLCAQTCTPWSCCCCPLNVTLWGEATSCAGCVVALSYGDQSVTAASSITTAPKGHPEGWECDLETKLHLVTSS